MSRSSRKAASSGKDPPPGDPPGDEASAPQTVSQEPVPPPSKPKPKTSYLWHLLAIVPIIVAFIIYNLPTIIDEYQMMTGLVFAS